MNKARAEFFMGPNNEVVVKNLIEKKITPHTKASLETMVIMNEMIAMATQWSEEKRELKMAEDALKDEPEWTVDDEPDDPGELAIILKEVGITSKTTDIEREKEKITEKTFPRKKLSSKQQ